MRILVAHNQYGQPSGEEYALCSLMELFLQHGHEVRVHKRSSAEIDKTFAGKTKAFFAGVANPWAARTIAQLLDREKPEIAFVQNLYPLLSPSILNAFRDRGVPVVMRCPNYRLFCPSGLHLTHGEICARCLGGKEYWCVLRNCENNFLKSLGYALRNTAARISRQILDNVTLFIVLSEFQRKRFAAGGIKENRVEVLPNPAPQVKGSSEVGAGDLITYVGRISPEKGIGDFVAAARRLPSKQFVVAGATERMPELVAQSPPNLEWLGFLQGKELNSLYARSRLLVLPSRCFEAFPNVVIMAMMMRKAVIASRIGALPEIVEDRCTGLLFEAGNLDELVEKIEELYCDPARCRRMGAAGRAKAETEYGPDVVYQRLMRICEKAIKCPI